MTDREPSTTGPRLTWLGPAVLVLWEGVLVYLLATGRYRDFLREDLWPLLLLAALLSGAFLTAMMLRPAAHPSSTESAIVRAGILVLPLLYVLAGHGKVLGSAAFGSRALDPLSTAAGPMSGEGPMLEGRMTVPQILRRGPALVGETVRTLGQVARGYGEPDDHFIVFRFVVNCCVADAYPQGFLVLDASDPPVPKDAWVEIEGTLDEIEVGPKRVLRLRPESVRRIAPPDRPYLYGR